MTLTSRQLAATIHDSGGAIHVRDIMDELEAHAERRRRLLGFQDGTPEAYAAELGILAAYAAGVLRELALLARQDLAPNPAVVSGTNGVGGDGASPEPLPAAPTGPLLDIGMGLDGPHKGVERNHLRPVDAAEEETGTLYRLGAFAGVRFIPTDEGTARLLRDLRRFDHLGDDAA